MRSPTRYYQNVVIVRIDRVYFLVRVQAVAMLAVNHFFVRCCYVHFYAFFYQPERRKEDFHVLELICSKNNRFQAFASTKLACIVYPLLVRKPLKGVVRILNIF